MEYSFTNPADEVLRKFQNNSSQCQKNHGSTKIQKKTQFSTNDLLNKFNAALWTVVELFPQEFETFPAQSPKLKIKKNPTKLHKMFLWHVGSFDRPTENYSTKARRIKLTFFPKVGGFRQNVSVHTLNPALTKSTEKNSAEIWKIVAER